MSEQEATLEDFADKEPERESRELFGLGQIPGSWNIDSLSELAEVIPGNSPPSSTYNEAGEGLPFFQGNAEFGHLNPTHDTWCSDPRKVAEPGDVLISIRAPVGDLNMADVQCCIGRGLAALRSNTMNSLYLYYHLAVRQAWLSRLATGSTFKSITKGDLQRLDVPEPPLEEQRKIASVLYTVDQAIQKTGKIIEQRRRIRDTLINELLTQGYYEYNSILRREDLEIAEGGINTDLDRTSVGGLPEEWETVRLEDVIESSLYGVAESAEDYQPDAPRYIRITDISEDGRLKNDELASLSDSKFDDKYLLSPGEILFARSGATVGKTYLYRESDPRAVYGGYLIRFVPDPNQILPEYLFYYTQSKAYENWVTRVTRKGAQENINAQEYSSLLLPLPPIEEQKKIIKALRVHRNLIQHEMDYQDQLKRLKQGLMQDLLSGEVRTHDKDIELVDDVLQHG